MKILKVEYTEQSKEYDRLSKMQETAEQMWKDGLLEYDDMMEFWVNTDKQYKAKYGMTYPIHISHIQ
jgi:hypothetical protein